MKLAQWIALAAFIAAVQAGCGQPSALPITQVIFSTATPTAIREPTLAADKLGTTEDLVPTDAEINTAYTHLAASKSFIALIPATLSTEYFYTTTQSARQRAENLNMAIEVSDPETDAAKQSDMIHNAVDRGAAVIVFSVANFEQIKDALHYAQSKHVFLVQFAGRQATDYGGVTISVEDADLGAAAGTFAGDLIQNEFAGNAKVVILDFPDAPAVVVRAAAIRTALLSAAPSAVIVGNFKGGTTEFGLASMQQALADYPGLNVVVSINDAGAYGAFQVLQAAGRSRANTIIVGIDGEDQARQYIAQGTMYRGTVDTSPVLTGETAINAAVKMLAGATLPQNVRVPVQLVKSQSVP